MTILKEKIKHILSFKNQAINILLVLSGLLMLLLFIWNKYIRERLPKDIPFNSSTLGLMILLYICCIYVYIIISLLIEKKSSNIYIEKFIYYIYLPLITLDDTLKNNKVLKPYFERFFIFLIEKCKIFSDFYTPNKKVDYIHLFYIFQIFPRVILVTALLIDTFYFNRLFYIYKVIPISILLIINRYIKYSFKKMKEQYLERLDYMTTYVLSDYDPEDYQLLTAIPIKEFMIEQCYSIVVNKKAYNPSPGISDNYRLEYRESKHLPLTPQEHELTFTQIDEMHNEFYTMMKILTPLSVHIDEYKYAGEYDESINLKIIIFSMYLLCWISILSVSALNMEEIWRLSAIPEPFSETILSITYLTNYKVKSTNFKRFTGNKPIGHINKILPLISKNTPPQVSFISVSKNIYIHITRRTMLTSLKTGTKSMDLAKNSFIKFCSHFQNINIADLHKDPIVIAHFKEMFHNHDDLCNRAFQLALEVTYNKRMFARKSLSDIFDKYFIFNNLIDKFDTTSDFDQSTLFNSLQSIILKKDHSTWNIEINQTPPSNIDIKDLSSILQDNLDINKKLTGNRFPDISIDGIPYDFKSVKDLSNTKNHVYIMIDSPEAYRKISQHLHDLITNRNIYNSFTTEYKEQFKNKLEFIKAALDNSKSVETKKEIINSWNDFLIKTSTQRPNNFAIPIFKITQTPNVSTNTLQEPQVIIPEGHLDYVKTKQALQAIIGNYPPNLQSAINNATKGSLGHLFDNTDTVD